jgi:hypothetical protein
LCEGKELLKRCPAYQKGIAPRIAQNLKQELLEGRRPEDGKID